MRHNLPDPQSLFRHALRVIAFALLCPWLSICHGESSFLTYIVSYNHTNTDIGYFTLRIGDSEGGGGFLQAHHVGEGARSIDVPNPWQPGLTATVGWPDNHGENYQDREVSIPEYAPYRTARVSVHFLRNGEIKVFVPFVALGHPNYPLKGSEAGLNPGEDPIEIRKTVIKQQYASSQDFVIAQLFRVIPGELKKLDRKQLDSFVAEQLKDAQASGLDNVDDQVQYMILALYTCGKFRRHPLVEARLAVPQSEQATAFAEWIAGLPDDVFSTGKPLWVTLLLPGETNENAETSANGTGVERGNKNETELN